MDLRWEHHLLSAFHPGILAAIIVAAIIAWFIGSGIARLTLKVKDPWRRVIYLFLPVCLVALLVYLLPSLLFYAGWRLLHPPYIEADLFMARHLLLVPFLVFLVSAAREFHSKHAATAARNLPANSG